MSRLATFLRGLFKDASLDVKKMIRAAIKTGKSEFLLKMADEKASMVVKAFEDGGVEEADAAALAISDSMIEEMEVPEEVEVRPLGYEVDDEKEIVSVKFEATVEKKEEEEKKAVLTKEALGKWAKFYESLKGSRTAKMAACVRKATVGGLENPLAVCAALSDSIDGPPKTEKKIKKRRAQEEGDKVAVPAVEEGEVTKKEDDALTVKAPSGDVIINEENVIVIEEVEGEGEGEEAAGEAAAGKKKRYVMKKRSQVEEGDTVAVPVIEEGEITEITDEGVVVKSPSGEQTLPADSVVVIEEGAGGGGEGKEEEPAAEEEFSEFEAARKNLNSLLEEKVDIKEATAFMVAAADHFSGNGKKKQRHESRYKALARQLKKTAKTTDPRYDPGIGTDPGYRRRFGKQPTNAHEDAKISKSKPTHSRQDAPPGYDTKTKGQKAWEETSKYLTGATAERVVRILKLVDAMAEKGLIPNKVEEKEVEFRALLGAPEKRLATLESTVNEAEEGNAMIVRSGVSLDLTGLFPNG